MASSRYLYLKCFTKPHILMKLFNLAFLMFFLQFFFVGNEASETKVLVPTKCAVETGATNILFQSTDGGRTWQDISYSLPVNQEPEDFFAGEADVYLRMNEEMYRSKGNLKTPVWEKEEILDVQNSSIVFNPSGTIAFNYEGQIYQKTVVAGTWKPAYTTFRKPTMRTIVEISDGTLFIGNDKGLYKSTDRGHSWKQVQKEGWTMDIIESEGVLLATGQQGIMRSTDKGEHWEWVISEGGVGIAIEHINGGFAAIVYSDTNKSRRIYSSMDTGKTWKAIDQGLRPALSISSIKQIGNYLICGHPDGILRSADMGKTWTTVHPGVSKIEFKYANAFTTPVVDSGKVFKLYVSGNVVYAVARNSGC
jgi:photosystem II stability/assembly factor-like uncharacterized protein